MREDNGKRVLKSPNQLLQEAMDTMGITSSPQTYEEWVVIMNCWAYNLPKELVMIECSLLNTIFDTPLTESDVTEIVTAQLKIRKREGNGR